jgi:hypothetical protein
MDYDSQFTQKLEKYAIKDFNLSQINYVCQMYARSINHFQHLFIDVPHLQRVPIEKKFNDKLEQMLNSTLIDSVQSDQNLNFKKI